MPASNSEARKRHEEAVAVTTDAMAEALSNVASGVVLEALPALKPIPDTVDICRDEDCPSCGYPETFATIDPAAPDWGAISFGCRKCGWRTDKADQ